MMCVSTNEHFKPVWSQIVQDDQDETESKPSAAMPDSVLSPSTTQSSHYQYSTNSIRGSASNTLR